jgi:hypothetical protein
MLLILLLRFQHIAATLCLGIRGTLKKGLHCWNLLLKELCDPPLIVPRVILGEGWEKGSSRLVIDCEFHMQGLKLLYYGVYNHNTALEANYGA